MNAEARGIAAQIRAHEAAGIPFRDQAILCRSHNYLARFAAALEALGIPVLYLGDLLSLLSLANEPGSSGLIRVATLPDYAVPLGDVQRVNNPDRRQR